MLKIVLGDFMNAQQLWQMFLYTGSPEVYLMYNAARRAEAANVLDDSGACAQSNTI